MNTCCDRCTPKYPANTNTPGKHRPALEHLRQHADQHHREHEAGPEGDQPLDELQPPLQVTDHHHGAKDVGGGGEDGEDHRVHANSLARSSSVSRTFSVGSSTTRASNRSST